MDLYLAGIVEDEVWEKISNKVNLNRLLSYHLQKKDIARWLVSPANKGKVFIDSGAFSAWTKGVSLNVDTYVDWLNNNSDKLDLFAQVDCIPGTRFSAATSKQVQEAAAKTWDNYLYMRKNIKDKNKLLYTFHYGEPIEYLKKALDWKDENGKYIPYIALGGMVGKSALERENFLDLCYHTIRHSSNKDIKVHAFGMTDVNLLEKYPVTSADSTSWVMNSAMGCIKRNGLVLSVSSRQKNDMNFYQNKLPKEALQKLKIDLDAYGITFQQLEEKHLYRFVFNALEYCKTISSLKQNYQKSNRLF